VRETWRPAYDADLYCCVEYRSDGVRRKPDSGALTEDQGHRFADDCPDDPRLHVKWRPSIFMPRWASRITLDITAVRVERVHDISERDALDEGIPFYQVWKGINDEGKCSLFQSHSDVYAHLWDSINGNRKGCAWADNPWVWALTFSVVKEAQK
jgi:hypothetical protein